MGAGTVIWYRFIFAAVLLGVILLLRGSLPAPLPKAKSIWGLFALAITCFAANNLVFLSSLGYITPTAAQLLNQFAPLLLLAGAVVVFKERFQRTQLIGVAVLMFGMGLFFRDRVGELFSGLGDYSVGVVLVLGSTVLWAVYALAQKQLLASYPSQVLMWSIYASGAVLLFAIAEPAQITTLSGGQVMVLVYCAMLTILGYGAFAEALAHWEASRVSAVIATTPLMTWGFNMIAAKFAPSYAQAEGLSFVSLIGAGLVTLGSALIALARRSE